MGWTLVGIAFGIGLLYFVSTIALCWALREKDEPYKGRISARMEQKK